VHDTLLSQSDIVPLKNEYEYVDGWHAVPPPATAKIATHIPGKMPGDPVDVAEINAAKFLFKDGDVIAVGKSSYQANYRLISHGDGSMSWQPEHPPGSGTYTTLQTYTKDMPKNALNGAKWTYGPDIIAKKAPSAISGFDSGDVVTADHIFAAAQFAPSDVNIAIAYAYDPAFVREYRVAKFGSDIQIQFRDANTTDVWKKLHFDVTQPSDIDVLGLKWRAAKMGGAGAPDEHLALFKGVPGQKVPAVGYPGKSVGDQISSAEILKSYNEHFKDLEIVAHGMSTFNTGVEYRMYWTDPTHLSMDYKENDGSGTWQFLTHIKDPQEWLKHNTNITWVATNDSVSAGSVSMKEAKKIAKTAEATITTKVGPKIVATNKVAGKVTGEVVEADDLLSNASAFDDGHVIAYGKGYGYSGKTYRLVRVDNQTIIQTQTKAGTWTQSHLVVNKYSGDFWNVKTWTVATENDVLAKPQLTAAKKFVAKATGTQTSAPVKTGKSYVPPSQPIKTTPFVLRPIDLTPWTDEEQKAIYDYYKQQSGSAHTGVEQVWGHVQNIKQHFQVTNPGGKYADLNEIHVLRILDAQGALKSNVTDTHPLEAKVVNWLKTPSGKSYINKRIDAPIAAHEVPAAMADFSASNISEDKQQYRIVTLSDARADRTQSLAKYGDWTAGQKSALKTYTGGAYHTWNDAIRKGELGSSRGSILNEQAAMRPSTRPMLLHRGTGFAELNDPSITNFESLKRHEGETYINRGFMSTSVGGHAAFSGQLLIEVEAPIGTPMAHVADFSSFKSENETTLAAHLVFRILSVEKKGGTTVMRVRVIGAAQG
jgi:hypothetical protein